MAVCIDDVTEGGFGLGDRLGSAAAIGCVAAPALAILQAIGTRAENARPTTKEAIVVAGTCSSTSPPRAPTTSRASPATRSCSACAAAGGRAPTKPNAPGSPTRSRCARTRSCRTSMAGSGSSSRRCGRMSQGWGRQRCRCWRWRCFELDRADCPAEHQWPSRRRLSKQAFSCSSVGRFDEGNRAAAQFAQSTVRRLRPNLISTARSPGLADRPGPIGGSARRSPRGQCVMCGSLRSPEGEPPACPGWGPGPQSNSSAGFR